MDRAARLSGPKSKAAIMKANLALSKIKSEMVSNHLVMKDGPGGPSLRQSERSNKPVEVKTARQ